MPERHEFIDYVLELFGLFGTVSAKRMFGGHGVYLDGLMFALVSREAIWLKADDINRGEFQAAGAEVFTYSRGGAQATIGFYKAPVEATESPAEMLPWARIAYAAALRANARRVTQERERAARHAARAVAAISAGATKAVAKRALKRASTSAAKLAVKRTKKRVADRVADRTSDRSTERTADRATKRAAPRTVKKTDAPAPRVTRGAKARPTKRTAGITRRHRR